MLKLLNIGTMFVQYPGFVLSRDNFIYFLNQIEFNYSFALLGYSKPREHLPPLCGNIF